MKEARHTLQSREDSDPRKKFVRDSVKNVEDEVSQIINDFESAGIVSDEFYEEIRKSSIDQMQNSLSSITHGFVGADLSALAKEAAMIVLRRVYPNLNLDEKEPLSEEILAKLQITHNDFIEALKTVRPSAIREVLVETPNIKWEDVGGLVKIKQELKEAIEWPLKYPESFKRLGIKPPKGVLLYGPPGTGKTLLAKAIAKESEANFIQIRGPSLLNMWVGESEKGVRKIFEKARQVAPTIIFFDEIDSLAPRRGLEIGSHVTERVVNTILAEMDGIEELTNVVVIAATNRPDILDPALLRPGRLDRLLLTPPPDEDARFDIFNIHTKEMPIDLDTEKLKIKAKKEKMISVKTAKKMANDEVAEEFDFEDEEEVKPIFEGIVIKKKEDVLRALAKKTEGYVGSDIESICREAAILTLRKNISAKKVTLEAFEEAVKKVKPSVSKEAMNIYKKLEQENLRSTRTAIIKETPPGYVG